MTSDLKEIVSKYASMKQDEFIKKIMFSALNKLILLNEGEYNGTSPEIEYLNYHNKFLLLFRRDSKKEFLDIAIIFRKVAHKIYRIMIKKDMVKFNNKFINLVPKDIGK